MRKFAKDSEECTYIRKTEIVFVRSVELSQNDPEFRKGKYAVKVGFRNGTSVFLYARDAKEAANKVTNIVDQCEETD